MWYSNLFHKYAMPYRWENSEDNAKNIIENGYSPGIESLLIYIDEYSDRFENDLPDHLKIDLEEFSEEIGLEEELMSYGRGGPKWEKYVEKLSDLWIGENKDAVLLWLADSPGSSFEFSGMMNEDDDYQNNLVRYSPEEKIEPFLSDHSYGYAVKVNTPDGIIPSSDFSIVSPEEWNKNKYKLLG